MNLGIILKNNKIINHRSLLKVILNPFLRHFGYQIVTVSNEIKLLHPVLTKCNKIPFFEGIMKSWFFKLEENEVLINERTLI